MCDCTDYADDHPCECSSSGSGSGSSSASSVEFSIGFPSFADGDQLRTGTLRFHHEEPSLTMFTLQGLDYLSPSGSYISQIEGDFTASEKVTITVANRRGQGRAYRVSDGSDTGVAIDSSVRKVYELKMLDASRDPIVDVAPTYVRLNNKNKGTYILLDYATGEAIEEVDEYGRVSTFQDVDTIRDEGVIVQIAYPGGLIDFHVIDPDFEYEIRFYEAGDFAYNATTDRYELNTGVDPITDATKRFNVVNPAYDSQDIDEAIITRYWDGRTTQWQFQYFANNDLWELRIGEVTSGTFTLLRREEAQLVENQDGTERTDVKRIYNGDDSLLSEVIKKSERIADAFKLVEKIVDPTGANMITRYGYYADGANAGKMKFKVEPDGTWHMFDYDSEERKILEVESWLDVALDEEATASQMAALAKVTEYSYTPVDSADDGSLQPDSARTETVSILGTVSSVTWNAYYRDVNGQYFEVSERATAQNSAYGDAANLRSETIHYATVAEGETALRSGRVKKRTSESGAIQEFDYTENGNGDFVVSETHLHADAPSGVAYKSTRRDKTYDPSANLIRDEMFVFDGSDYQSVYYLAHSYDADRNKTESRRFDGITGGRVTYSATYSHGKAVTEVDETGLTVNTTYDVLDRKEFEVITGSTAAGVGDIIKYYSYSTAATGCGCTAAEVLIQNLDGTLSMTEVNETDRVKRKTRTVDVNGMETLYEYSDGGRITAVTNPDGSTRITTKYLDGRIKSVTGTGVVPQYYTYGVNPDGFMWTRVDAVDATYAGVEDISAATGLRYTKSTEDLLGRTVREESPSFTGGVLLREYSYDAYSRLESQSETGRADTLYIYGTSGELIRSGLDVNDDGQLVLASNDRITDSERIYSLESGAWFDLSTTQVYPTANDASAVTVSTLKRRLSGFSGALTSESISEDIDGNQIVRSVEIDRANRTVTRTSTTPGSSINAVSVSINGYLKEQNSTTVAASTTFSYDGLGRRIAVKDPRHTQSVTIDYYTGTRQVFTQTDAAGNTTSFTYYGNGVAGAGQIKSVTNALSQSTYYAYDLLGRQIQTWGETDYPQEYGYNAFGELSTLTTWRDAADTIDFSTATWPAPTAGTGDTTTWTYAPATGLLTRKEYADGNGTDYSYDSANRLLVRTWARNGGLDTTYGYDAATGELLTVDYEDAATADITYTFDRMGRQSTVSDATGTRSFDYSDTSLRLNRETLPSAFYGDVILERAYENGTETNGLAGRPAGYLLGTSIDLDAYQSVEYAYTANGRFQSVTDGTDSFNYSYETNSNLLASITAPQHSVDYTYEPNRDVLIEVDNQVSGSTISKYGYSYDALGRRDDRTQSGSEINTASTDDFIYNTRSEVTGSTNSVETATVWNPTYSFDKIGNRESSTGSFAASYTANELNQYTAIDSTNPVHDADGNLTSDGIWTYTWNNENRLASATNGTVTIDFTYDYQGRLVKKDDGSTVEVYVYEGWNRIATFELQTSTLTLQTSYLWGLDLSGTLQGAGGVGGLLKEGGLYPTFDANGNIMQKLDGAGTAVMSVDYDPFGNIIAGTLTGEYGFSTKPLIDGILMYYYGFRYYDPGTGRWLSRDSIEEDGGVNLYAFVYNQPLSDFDILGQQGCDKRTGRGCRNRRSGNASVYSALSLAANIGISFTVPIPIAGGVGVYVEGSVEVEEGNCCDDDGQERRYRTLNGTGIIGLYSGALTFSSTPGGVITLGQTGDCEPESSTWTCSGTINITAAFGPVGLSCGGTPGNMSCRAYFDITFSGGVSIRGGGGFTCTKLIYLN
jgi:RHS repeat-associated protein